ncbi:tetratricopeptide repeat protein [Marinimicrococcus flavescens]|uniref:Tetratricopeptide repeat protein n=1 Tax=Marinimicrococcus flavescens TaxID=3031815 RepID=A0AAP3V0R0_9PROT|nr:tetratricopeptide repeat protein [Marinimicrococcus flavescens]
MVAIPFRPAAVFLALLLLAGCASSAPDIPLAANGETAPLAEGANRAQSVRLAAMAADALRIGDAGTAVGLYHRAALLDGENRTAGLGLGEALLQMGRPEDAVEAFRRLLRDDPGDAEAARGYARAMIGLDRPDAAAAQLEETVVRHPQDYRLNTTLGVALDLLGRHGEAETRYRAALAVVPGDSAATTNLGLSLALAGRYEEAIRLLEPVAKGPGSTLRARQNLAAAYALAGDTEAARRLLRLDLDDKAVRENLAYFTWLRDGGRSASAARAMVQNALARPLPAATATAPRAAAQPGGARPLVPGRPVAVAPAVAPLPAVPPAPAAAAPQEPAAAAVALGGADLRLGGEPAGDWVVELAAFSDSRTAVDRFRALQVAHPELFAGTVPLAGTGEDAEPMLVGPYDSAARARAVCAALAPGTCKPLRL